MIYKNDFFKYALPISIIFTVFLEVLVGTFSPAHYSVMKCLIQRKLLIIDLYTFINTLHD